MLPRRVKYRKVPIGSNVGFMVTELARYEVCLGEGSRLLGEVQKVEKKGQVDGTAEMVWRWRKRGETRWRPASFPLKKRRGGATQSLLYSYGIYPPAYEGE